MAPAHLALITLGLQGLGPVQRSDAPTATAVTIADFGTSVFIPTFISMPSSVTLTFTPVVSTPIPKSSNNQDILIATAIAAGVGVFLLVGLIFIVIRRRKKKKHGLKEEKPSDISSHREVDMQTVLTTVAVMPDCLSPNDCRGDDFLFRNRSSADSVETLLDPYTVPPIQIPSLPVAGFEEEDRISIRAEDSQRLSQTVRDSYIPNDAANSTFSQRGRPLPTPPVSGTQLEDSGPVYAAAEVSKTSTASTSSSNLIVLPRERHADSGIRLGRQTISYDGTVSDWSLRSKDKLPPLYTHN